MRRFIFASHHKLAYGLKDTVDFLTSNTKDIYDINAYMDNEEEELGEVIEKLFASFAPEDEVIVLTDLLGGSVNQQFFSKVSSRIHVICGMNLSLAMAVVMMDEHTAIDAIKIAKIIEESKNQILYMNQMKSDIDNDDE